VFTRKNVLLLQHSIIFSKLGACAETISRFLIFQLATDPISIENSLSAEIGSDGPLISLKLNQVKCKIFKN
jgi:hypothetical protein